MAYLNFAEHGGAPALGFSFAASAPVADAVPNLGAREWSVIRLARDDSLSSIFPESRLGRLVRLIFGLERKNILSNPRLEALRRIAVMSWHHGYNVAPSEISDFLNAGYTRQDYETLMDRVVAERAPTGRRTRR